MILKKLIKVSGEGEIGIIGLSIGHSVSVSAAMERSYSISSLAGIGF